MDPISDSKKLIPKGTYTGRELLSIVEGIIELNQFEVDDQVTKTNKSKGITEITLNLDGALLKRATTPNHPQSSPITQNIVTITHNHPQSPKILSQSPPQSPKILSQPPTVTQNIVTNSENVVTDSSNHPHIITQTQQTWLTLFCENYYFTKKITNLRKKLLICEEKVESKSKKMGIKVQKSGVKIQIANLRRKLLICERKSKDQSPKRWGQSPHY